MEEQKEQIVEFELSAEEVRNLSGPRTVRVTVTTPTPPKKPTRRIWRSPFALAGAGTVLCLALGAGYGIGLSKPPAPTQALPIPAPVEVSAKPLVVDEPPLRVRNPFDKREVFEFPAGTTEKDAHDAVADMLLQRAAERQALYDARHSKRRRST